MARPLNIAHCVESYAPALGGMAEVVRQLSERMVRMGHRVTVYTSAHENRTTDELNGVTIRSLRVSGNAVYGIKGDANAYINAIKTGDHDLVTFFAAQQWATDALLPHLADIPAKKVFVPTGFSALRDPQWSSYYSSMPGWLAAMDLVVFHTEDYQDVRFAKEHGLTNHILIPNGAAEEEFEAPPKHDFRKAHGIRNLQPIVVHLGSYTGIKGHREALEIFVKASTADAVLVLIGNGNKVLAGFFNNHWRYALLRWKARRRGKRILFLELDRASTVDALKQAALFLFPSNVECSPIVLFEAMAAGVPFLASEAGNSGEIARWTNGGWIISGARDAQRLVRTDIAEGARMLSELLADTDRLRAAGSAGQREWKERFTWQRIAEQYAAAYQRIISGS